MLYLVHSAHRSGSEWIGHEVSADALIEDIIAGQIENVTIIRAICADGVWIDMSEAFAREIASRVQRDPVRADLLKFISHNVPDALALELNAA